MSHIPRPPTRRPPLGEATGRVNNSQQQPPNQPRKASMPHHESREIDGLLHATRSPVESSFFHGDHDYDYREALSAGPVNPRLSAISKEYPSGGSKRDSQISTVSTNASDGKRIKGHIGPWRLGRTLGKGATARVRFARNAYTGQEAAVKIVPKNNAQLSQAHSLNDLDRADASLGDVEDGVKRMPVGIEREVAIMKLIRHPNIMKLYDIWENRTEIYIVLEYVDNGELFDHIVNRVRLDEEEAMVYFRQILSAVGYCHSFNICHRDLKPENILLTKDDKIKIADFGMAALHQSPDHKLKTSCGSPHYAAPELIRGVTYRGDKIDIWSLGVILYAMLAGRLPFDVEGITSRDWLGPLLSKIRKGQYEMAPEFSEDAANLIRRMLQVNPRDRYNMSQIWKHPLLRRYDYLDDLGRGAFPQCPSVKDCGRPVLRRSDIDKELLRHLRTMWHSQSEQKLMDALLSEEPNDQKLFYTLLLKYREEQLENYVPGIDHSTSDYHHVRPPALTKAYSTCHFPQPNARAHGRQVSKFTVISNAAETEMSYDPFKASRPQHLNGFRNSTVKITIHRNREDPQGGEDADENTLGNASRQTSRAGSIQRGLVPPKGYASRSSLASSTRSGNSGAHVRPNVGRKRGVSFSHLRKASFTSQMNTSADAVHGRHSKYTEVTDDGGSVLRAVRDTSASARYIRSRKAQSAASQPILIAKRPGRTSHTWIEDVQQLSSSLAKDCDEAFNHHSVISNGDKSSKQDPTPIEVPNSNRPKATHVSLDSRPLPTPPARTESVKNELLEARKLAELRKKSGGNEPPGYLDRMVSHIDRLIQPGSPVRANGEPRSSSAPAENRVVPSTRPLPSIHEAGGEEPTPRNAFLDHQSRLKAKGTRIASAPEPREINRNRLNDRFTNPDSLYRDTIRAVQPSSPPDSPVKPPAPLTIRKKSAQGGPPLIPPPMISGGLGTSNHPLRPRQSGLELRQQYHVESKANATPDLHPIDENQGDEDLFADESTGTIVRKKSSWFKRSSRSREVDFQVVGPETLPSQSSNGSVKGPHHRPPIPHLNNPLPETPKKKGFSLGKFFKKRNNKQDMAIGTQDVCEDNTSFQDSMVEAQRQSHAAREANHEDPRARQIAPQQNWLAKLFHVKPAAKFICFTVSKRRARQEITTVLREWKRYGLRDVQVDKERNIVFGRVASKNYLDMKEVQFAGEIMTVIEHGKKSHLSIARFTQERGAASSFHKVVDTLETVCKCRGILLTDERKKRMMIKTLNAA